MILLPFKAWLPKQEFAELVAAKSTGYANSQEIIKLLQNNPLSYLHAVKPYLHFGTENKIPELHFAYGANYIKQLQEQSVIKQEQKNAFYLYKQSNESENSEFYGLISLCNHQSYMQGKIKLHEKTITEKENLLIEHIKYTKMTGEPVLMMHAYNKKLDEYFLSIMKTKANLFLNQENVAHQVWVIDNEDDIARISSFYQKIDSLYLADGHHRSAAINRYIADKKIAAKGFMSLSMFANHLKILPFHRMIRSNGIDLISGLQKRGFNITKSDNPVMPFERNCFGLFYNNEWYAMNWCNNPAYSLDVICIENEVLLKILAITNSQIDDNIDFIAGNNTVNQILNTMVSKNFDTLITLHHCEIEDVCKIADNGSIMPPKSTYILPKLLTGFTIHELI